MNNDHLISCDTKTLAIISKALEHFGPVPQQMKAIEEMAELTKEICKEISGLLSNREAVIEEIADVQIVLWQMQLLYGVDRVQDRIKFKLRRLENRMELGS